MKKRFKQFLNEMSVLKALGFGFIKDYLGDNKKVKEVEKLMDQQDELLGDFDNKAIDKWMEKFVDVKDVKEFGKVQAELAKILKTMKAKNPAAKKAFDITKKLINLV